MGEAIVRITFNREKLEELDLELEVEIDSMIDNDDLGICVVSVEEI